MTLPAELNGGNGEAMNGVLSELPDTAGSAGDNAGLSVPPVSPGGPESGMHGKVGTLELFLTGTSFVIFFVLSWDIGAL